MGGILIIISLFALCKAAELPEYKPGTLISGPGISRVIEDANTQCAGKTGQFCSKNNCDSVVTCDANGGTETLCSKINPKNNYCVNNACQPSMDPTQACPAKSYVCNAEGYLPDANNCALYYYCPQLKGEAWQFDCGTGYAFDITTFGCKRRRYSTDCPTMVCKAGVTNYIAYAPQPSIYTFCNNGASSVLKCTDEIYEAINVSSGLCEVVCKAEGNQQNRRSCTDYHYCYKSGSKLVYKTVTCPDTFWFDPVKKVCAVDPGKCEPEIKS